MNFKYIIYLIKIEYMYVIAEMFRRKAILFSLLMWPYLLMFFVVIIGSVMGGIAAFQKNVGTHPVIFFITSSFLLMSSLVFFDDVASRFWYDEFIGTLPYILISPVPKVILALTMGIPRLLLNIILGFSSLMPVYFVFKGVQGITDSLIVIVLSFFSALTFSTLAVIFASLVLLSGGGWRVMNILRPLILVLSGVMYPRFLLPFLTKIITGFIPLSHNVEVIQLFIRYNIFTEYSLMLLGIAVALAILYTPLSIKGLKLWEARIMKTGVKT